MIITFTHCTEVDRSIFLGTASFATSVADLSNFSTATMWTRSCNVTACRSTVANHISRNQTYNTTSFGECIGCSNAIWPNFPDDWLERWYVENMVVYSSVGSDCPGNPMYGNLIACQMRCLQVEACVGFSRAKSAAPNDSTSQCWLKYNIQQSQTFNDPTWHTYAFNTTS